MLQYKCEVFQYRCKVFQYMCKVSQYMCIVLLLPSSSLRGRPATLLHMAMKAR